MTSQISWLKNLLVRDDDSIKLLAGTNLSFSGNETVIVDGPQLNVLHEFSSDSFGSARYFIHAECGSDQRETLEATVVTKLDQAAITVFGRVNTGVDLINVSADITNSILKLYATPAVEGLQNIKCTVFATLAENIIENDSRATVYYFTKVQSNQFIINAGPYTVDQDKPQLTFYRGLTYRFDQSDSSNDNNPLLIGTGADGGAGNFTFNYTVTVSGPQGNDVGNKYILNGIYKPSLDFLIGYTYVFNQDDDTNVYWPNAIGTTVNRHPLNFSADNISGEQGGGTSYLAGVEYRLNGAVVSQAVYNSSAFDTATARQVRISISSATPSTLYYWCYNHVLMGNSITSTYIQGLHYYLNGNLSSRAGYLDTATFNAATQRYVEFTVKDDTPSLLYYFSSQNNNFGNAVTVSSLVQSGIGVGGGSGGSGGSGGGSQLSAANVSLSNLEPTAINLSLIPNVTSSIDLGSNDKRWRDLYLSGNSLIIGDATITAVGSIINLPAGTTVGGQSISGGGGSGSTNSFEIISVPGQNNIVADQPGDTLTVVAGSGISITTNAGTDTLTIVNSSPNINQSVFNTISVSGQPNVVADQPNDTLTLVAGPNITITTNATNDSITISSLAGGGSGGGGVSAGQVNRLAYYASTGSIIQDTGANLTWNGTDLNIIGSISASAEVSYVRAYFDTLAELQIISPITWHGMVAHVHETGRMYFAHANAWVPLANQSDLVNNFSTITVAGQNNVVADQLSDILTLAAGTGIAITTNAGTDTITISATGGGGTASNSFETISVAGQPDVVADSSTDTLTLVAGTGIAITTNAATDTLTISNTATAVNSFGTLIIAGQSNVVADQPNDVLTLVAGLNVSITTDASTDTVTINAVSGGASANSFATISVAGQNNVVADQLSDTLTLAAGANVTITTDSSTDTITIAAAAAGSQNVFSTIAVAGQSDVVADSSTDTLTLVAGTGITITTNASTDTLTFSAASGSSTFNSLTDVTSAGITVDRIAYPAITMLQTTNSGASAYLFNNQYSGNNPTLYALSGTTIAFNLNVVGHPFLIQTSGGTNYDIGLIHVSTTGTVSTGASAQGQTLGTLYWQIPIGTTGNYRYICSIHGAMVGVITIKDFVSI